MRLLLLLIISTNVLATDFKFRAREHYEVHKVDTETGEYEYRGFNNTMNAWWEVPYQYAIGFSFSPLFANLKAQDDDSPLGEKITYINYGIEFKYFVWDNLFTRLGLAYSKLESNEWDDVCGTSSYLGLGYEIPLDMLGVALEYALRYSELEDDITVNSMSPSIGFHFYKNI